MLRYGFMGIVYFFLLPAAIVLSYLFSPSSRKQIVFFTVELGRNIINLMMIFMVSSKHSKYSSIKQGSQSFFQEGNKLL